MNYIPQTWHDSPATDTPVSAARLTVMENGIASGALWDIDPASANGVQRIRHSTENYLSNASFEAWLNGTSVAPNGWTLNGDASVSRSSTATLGAYSAQVVFGTANTGEFYQDIGVSNLVDYTFSCYVQRISGSGTARLVAQQEGSPFTEYVTVNLATGGGWQLAVLTVKPTTSGLMRFSVRSGNAVSSAWLIDECQAQESKGVATAFQHSTVNDTTEQFIYAKKTFLGGVALLVTTTGSRPSAAAAGQGAMMYDSTLSKPIWSDGSAWKDATGTTV